MRGFLCGVFAAFACIAPLAAASASSEKTASAIDAVAIPASSPIVLDGKLNEEIWQHPPAIVDFVFTRCPAACPRLTARMKELEQLLPKSSKVRLLSISVDPEYDRQAVAATLSRRGVVRAQEIAATLVPASARQFLEGGAATQDALAAVTEWVTVPAGSARLHAPIADPGKFICIGLNYSDHAAETGNAIPKEPPIFAKWPNAILDPGEPILRPRGSKALDAVGVPGEYVELEKG